MNFKDLVLLTFLKTLYLMQLSPFLFGQLQGLGTPGSPPQSFPTLHISHRGVDIKNKLYL